METFRYRCFARAWAMSAMAHLTLPDALQWSWLIPDMLLFAGASGLLLMAPSPRKPLGFACFALCAVGLLWPLVALGDQLTQSGYLLCGALAALSCSTRKGDGALMLAIRLLTVAVYGAAFFHKLNADFLNPSVSCATGGMRVLAENWSLPLAPAFLDGVWPPLFLLNEGLLVTLFVIRPRAAVMLALLVHIPLTIIFAPSFAWVMASGWVAFFREDELEHLVQSTRRQYKYVLAIGLGLGGLSAALYFQDHWVPYPVWQLKELGVWIAFAAYLMAQPSWPKGDSVWSQSRAPRAAFAWAIGAVFVLNALTPYSGLQFHHAGAMLSNLRVDEGCWNHLLVPEAIRVREPYIRIDEVHVAGEVRGARALEAQIHDRLWHPADLDGSMARYCAAGAGPISLRMVIEGQVETVEDACTMLALPNQARGLFQTNLLRECPQTCVH